MMKHFIHLYLIKLKFALHIAKLTKHEQQLEIHGKAALLLLEKEEKLKQLIFQVE